MDAFGEKVDRIANYIKAQEAFAEAAKKEAGRLEARRKSADHRVKACKGFLCWFMTCRSLKHLKGRLNTLTLARNPVDSLVLEEGAAISPAFLNVTMTLSWGEWNEVVSLLPDGALRSRLEELAHSCTSIDRTRVADALRAGATLPSARLVRGQHIRLS